MATKRSISDEQECGNLERLLLDHYVTLSEELQVKKVFRHLQQRRILQVDDKEEILKCDTSQEMAEKLLDKVMTRGTCTPSMFVDVLRRSGHEHLADMLEGEPNSKVAKTEGYRDMTRAQLRELQGRLGKVYREEVERHKGATSLEGLKGFEMGDAEIGFWVWSNTSFLISIELLRRGWRTLLVEEVAGRQVGTAFAADWVGNKKFSSDYKQMYKLKLNKVRKNQRIIDIIFDQLLHDSKYEPSFSKETLWRHMEQTQDKILFVLEGLDRLNPFTCPEILQLIDKKLLPRVTVIVTVAEANGG